MNVDSNRSCTCCNKDCHADAKRFLVLNAEMKEFLQECLSALREAKVSEFSRTNLRELRNRGYALISRAEQPEPEPETCVWDDRGTIDDGWLPRCHIGDGGYSKWEYPTAPKTCPSCGNKVEVKR